MQQSKKKKHSRPVYRQPSFTRAIPGRMLRLTAAPLNANQSPIEPEKKDGERRGRERVETHTERNRTPPHPRLLIDRMSYSANSSSSLSLRPHVYNSVLLWKWFTAKPPCNNSSACFFFSLCLSPRSPRTSYASQTITQEIAFI